MKKAYSEFTYMDKDYVEAFKNLNPVDAVKNLMTATGMNAMQAIQELAMIRMGVHGNVLAKSGDCTHYFFKGAGFYSWLESAAPPLATEHMDIVKQLCGHDKCVMLHYEGGLAPCYLVFTAKAIDFDMSEHGERLIINQGKNQKLIYTSPGFDAKGDYEILKPSNIVAASIAYILAFPDMVQDGIPDDLRHPNHYRKAKAKCVGMSPQIIERDGPSPHFRVGHFRHLTSDRYKNKKGQTVFVRGSFVKGRASTVLSPDSE